MTLSSPKGSSIKKQVSQTVEDCLSSKVLKSVILATSSAMLKVVLVIFSVTHNNIVVTDLTFERVIENRIYSTRISRLPNI